MQAYPLKLTHHVRAYAFGGRPIPEMLGKEKTPEGVVADAVRVGDEGEGERLERAES